jgi:hypothetical protein
MPPGIILSTFNPTKGWLKNEIYEKWKNGELKPPYYFKQALPQDNPFVTEDQWSSWQNMDEISYKRFIEGDWDAADTTNLFMYAFRHEKHVAENLPFNPILEIWFSFDFNVDPMTCIVAQHNRHEDKLYVLKEFRIENIGVKEFIQIVKEETCKDLGFEWRKARIKVTGDPAGSSRHGIIGNSSYYTVIQSDWRLHARDLVVQNFAPPHEDSRVHCNSLLERYKDFKIDAKCKNLISDMATLKTSPDGRIEKINTGKDGTGKRGYAGHLVDCLRYLLHTLFPNFLDFSK